MTKKTIVVSSEQIAHVIRMRSGGLIPPEVADKIAEELLISFGKKRRSKRK